MLKPLVSIIIPLFNREELIAETINSVLDQTYSNWECIIVDDGSIDDSKLIVEKYIERDPRIQFFQRPAAKIKGASSCRNYGLEKAKGELIQFLDSDDLMAKNKLEEQVKLYNPEDLSLITCKWGGFEESSNLTKRFKYKYHSYRNFYKGIKLLNTFGDYNEYFPLHVYLIPEKLIEKAGLWNENLTNNDDAEFFTRVILNASKINFTHETSAYYRYESTNKLSEFNSQEKVISAIESWKLIESHMKEKSPFIRIKYLKNGKTNLYNSVINNFPDIVAKELVFFNDRKNYSNRVNRFLERFGLSKFPF